jgi:adenylate cyclase
LTWPERRLKLLSRKYQSSQPAACDAIGQPMPDQRYTFERWILDCGRGTLTAETGDVALRPKSFEVLRFLIENAGRLVSRDDLLNAVWPAVTVTEESLTQCVSEVRNALDDPGQRIIKTVPKRGYVFAVPVNCERHGGRDAAKPPRPAARILDDPSIAVAPFANLSGDTSQEYLSDGLTEDIINGLSCFSDLSVIARSSSFSYKGCAIDVREVGQQLGVRYIVEGSVRRMGDRIRITAELVDAQSGVQRWAERFDRELGDIFAIQDEITQSIVRIVVAHLGNAEEERVSRKPPSSWTAYELLMRGDQALRTYEQSWAPNHLYEARRHFAEAHKSDPDNARICAMLGYTYVRAHADPAVPEIGDTNVLKHGYELVSKAVGLDPNLPLARALLGSTLWWMHEPDAAVREYERALALNPNFWNWTFAGVLVYAGAAARALDVAQAHVRLDPFHPPYVHAYQGHALYMLKRYTEAVTPLRESIRRGPQVLLGHVWLAATLIRLGQRTEAREIVAKVLKRAPNMTLARWRAPTLYRNPQDSEHMIEALREAGFS